MPLVLIANNVEIKKNSVNITGKLYSIKDNTAESLTGSIFADSSTGNFYFYDGLNFYELIPPSGLPSSSGGTGDASPVTSGTAERQTGYYTTGFTGSKGEKGPLGYTGSVGYTGSQGEPGVGAPIYRQNMVSGNITLDISQDRAFELSLIGNTTITIIGNLGDNAGILKTIVIRIIQDIGAPHYVTWANTIKWSGGYAPGLMGTIGGSDLLQLASFDGGVSWVGGRLAQMAG